LGRRRRLGVGGVRGMPHWMRARRLDSPSEEVSHLPRIAPSHGCRVAGALLQSLPSFVRGGILATGRKTHPSAHIVGLLSEPCSPVRCTTCVCHVGATVAPHVQYMHEPELVHYCTCLLAQNARMPVLLIQSITRLHHGECLLYFVSIEPSAQVYNPTAHATCLRINQTEQVFVL
jgi:hypothetical protein